MGRGAVKTLQSGCLEAEQSICEYEPRNIRESIEYALTVQYPRDQVLGSQMTVGCMWNSIRWRMDAIIMGHEQRSRGSGSLISFVPLLDWGLVVLAPVEQA